MDNAQILQVYLVQLVNTEIKMDFVLIVKLIVSLVKQEINASIAKQDIII